MNTYRDVTSMWTILLETPQDTRYRGTYDNRSGNNYWRSSSFYKNGTPHNVHITVALQGRRPGDRLTHFHISVEVSSSAQGVQNVGVYFDYDRNGRPWLWMRPDLKGKTHQTCVNFDHIYRDIKPELKQMGMEFFNKYARPSPLVTHVN